MTDRIADGRAEPVGAAAAPTVSIEPSASESAAPEVVVGERLFHPSPQPIADERVPVSVEPLSEDPERNRPDPGELLAERLVEPPAAVIADPAPPERTRKAVAARPKKSWREQRWERRRRRVWFEEVLAWFLVPVILIGGYFLVDGILSALGTSVSAIINGLSTISSNL